jgi:hypothetical protein
MQAVGVVPDSAVMKVLLEAHSVNNDTQAM